MRIARSLLDQIVAQARAEAPNECCGIVSGRDGRAVAVMPARNARASPLAYEIDGRDLVRIYDELDREGLTVAIIYHSHTRSPAEPSQTDINLASPLLPDALYLIVGIEDPDKPDIRTWRIQKGDAPGEPARLQVTVSEASLEVEEG